MAYASLRFGGSQVVSRLAAACLGAALLAACSTNPDSQTGSLNTETNPGQDRPMVKIGLLVPLSAQGQPGVIGKSLKQAAELALFERDNPNLQLIVKDDRGTPDGAKTAAEDALKGGATLLLGPLFAKSVAAVAPVARKAGVPVIAFSNDRQVAGSGVYLLSFQPAPEVERVVAYAASRGKRRYAALISQDAFGKLVEPVFRNAVSRSGGTIVAIETYQTGSANAMLEPLRKISAAITAADAEGGPVDALFVPGGQEQLEPLGRLLPQAQIDTQQVKLIGTGGMDYPNAGRDSGLVGAWYPGPDPARLDRLFSAIRQELRPLPAAHRQPRLRFRQPGHRPCGRTGRATLLGRRPLRGPMVSPVSTGPTGCWPMGLRTARLPSSRCNELALPSSRGRRAHRLPLSRPCQARRSASSTSSTSSTRLHPRRMRGF